MEINGLVGFLKKLNGNKKFLIKEKTHRRLLSSHLETKTQLWASEDEDDDEGFERKQKENSSGENATDETDTIITNPVKTPVGARRIDLCVRVRVHACVCR